MRIGAGLSPVIALPPFLFLIKKHPISFGESLLLSVISIWRGHGRGAISFSCFPSVSTSVSVLFLVCPGGARNQVCADGRADGKGQGEGRQKPFVICNSGSTKRRSGKNFLVVKGCVQVVWVGSLLCLDLGCGGTGMHFLSLSRGEWYFVGIILGPADQITLGVCAFYSLERLLGQYVWGLGALCAPFASVVIVLVLLCLCGCS